MWGEIVKNWCYSRMFQFSHRVGKIAKSLIYQDFRSVSNCKQTADNFTNIVSKQLKLLQKCKQTAEFISKM